MRKNKPPMYDERARRRWSPQQFARLLMAAVTIGPFAIDGGVLLYGRWMRVLGHRTTIRTPALDQVSLLFRSAAFWLMAQFRSVPWNPQAVIAVGIACCVACMVLLKGKGSRIQ